MDIFAEQLVKKEADGKTIALKILIGILTALVAAVSVFLMLMGLPIVLLAGIGAVYGGYYLITGLDCEYEYIVTNGDIDVDKIIAKRKRKRLITAKASLFERFGKLEDAPEVSSSATIVKVDGLCTEDTELYYADFTHQTIGETRLIFSPTEKLVEGIVPFLPRNTRVEYDRTYNRK